MNMTDGGIFLCRYLFFVHASGALGDYIAWTGFDLKIQLTYIFAYDPEAEKLYPHKKQIIQVIEAQPVTVLPEKYLTNDQIIPAKLSRATAIPSPVIRRSGFVDRLVIQSSASESIFTSG